MFVKGYIERKLVNKMYDGWTDFWFGFVVIVALAVLFWYLAIELPSTHSHYEGCE